MLVLHVVFANTLNLFIIQQILVKLNEQDDLEFKAKRFMKAKSNLGYSTQFARIDTFNDMFDIGIR